MGISKGVISLLLEARNTNPLLFKGSILQLGKQDIYLKRDQINSLMKKYGNKKFIQSEVFDDKDFFELIGFEDVQSLDANDYESSTIIHDMNNPIEEKWFNNYDCVFDGGTLEHIFNVKESFENINKLLKTGGIVIHASPSSNHVDHGFYMFSPTLFYDFYTTNGYEIIMSKIFEYTPNHANEKWKIYDYKPGSIDTLSFGGWGNKMLGIYFVARKTAEMNSKITIPQQGYYKERWISPEKFQNNYIDTGKLKKLIISNRFLYPIAFRINLLLKRNKPKVEKVI